MFIGLKMFRILLKTALLWRISIHILQIIKGNKGREIIKITTLFQIYHRLLVPETRKVINSSETIA